MAGDEGDGRLLTIDPPWAAGVHQQPSTLFLPRFRDAARRPLNGRILLPILPPSVSIRVHRWLLSLFVHLLDLQRENRVAIQLEVLDANR